MGHEVVRLPSMATGLEGGRGSYSCHLVVLPIWWWKKLDGMGGWGTGESVWGRRLKEPSPKGHSPGGEKGKTRHKREGGGLLCVERPGRGGGPRGAGERLNPSSLRLRDVKLECWEGRSMQGKVGCSRGGKKEWQGSSLSHRKTKISLIMTPLRPNEKLRRER